METHDPLPTKNKFGHTSQHYTFRRENIHTTFDVPFPTGMSVPTLKDPSQSTSVTLKEVRFLETQTRVGIRLE